MKSSTVLRWCVVLIWIFGLAGLVADFALQSSLPAPLAAWLKADAARDPTLNDLVGLGASVLLIVSALVSTVGLLRLRRWAAWLYLATSILGTILSVVWLRTVLGHAYAYACYDVSTTFHGMVIALAFFTDSLNENSAEPVTSAANQHAV